jgi:membrane-associated protein
MVVDSSAFDIIKDLPHLIESVGQYGVWLIIFLECCIFFFLPGDSLLLMAGIFAAQGYMDITVLTIGCIVAAIAGNEVGYLIGKRYGRGLFANEKGRFFNPQNLAKTEEFYAKHGQKAIVIARFLPIVRTFIPVFAGACGMKQSTFFLFNCIGAIIWCGGLCVAGYFLGQVLPPETIKKYMHLAILGIVALCVLPPLVHWGYERWKRRKV